jgi:TniQ
MTDPDLPRPLPVRPRPHAGETTASYVRRLARANHLRPSVLNRYLRAGNRDVLLDWLAALAGRYPTDLAKALAEYRGGHLPNPAPRAPAESIRQRRARTALFAAIRRDAVNNPALSTRFLAERHGVHRRTIQTALATAAPPPRKPLPRRGSRLDRHQAVIDAMLTKPRLRRGRATIQQIHDHLTNDLGLDISYSTVRIYVHARREHLAPNPDPDQIR